MTTVRAQHPTVALNVTEFGKTSGSAPGPSSPLLLKVLWNAFVHQPPCHICVPRKIHTDRKKSTERAVFASSATHSSSRRVRSPAACKQPGFHKLTPEKPKRTIWVVHGRGHNSTRRLLPTRRKKAKKTWCKKENTKFWDLHPSGPHPSGTHFFSGFGPPTFLVTTLLSPHSSGPFTCWTNMLSLDDTVLA